MTQATKVPTFTLKVTYPSYKLMDCKAQLIPHLAKLGFMPRDVECLITNTMAQLKNGKTYFLSLAGDKPSRANDYTTSFQLTSMGA